MRAFRPYSGFEIERFEGDLQTAHAEWSERWLPKVKRWLHARIVSAESSTLDEGIHWYSMSITGHAVYYGATAHDLQVWASILLDVSAESENASERAVSPVLSRIAAELVGDLVARLLRKQNCNLSDIVTGLGAVADKRGPDDGYLLLQLQLGTSGRTGLAILLPPDTVLAWNRQLRSTPLHRERETLAKRADSIGHAALKLDVELEGDALSVAEFQELQVGDVLRFKQPIHRPLRVIAEGGHLVGFCHLGRIGDRRGIQLAKTPENMRHV